MELSFRTDDGTDGLSVAEPVRWKREPRHAGTGVAAFHAYRLSLAGEWIRTAEGNHAFTLDRANQLGQRIFRSGPSLPRGERRPDHQEVLCRNSRQSMRQASLDTPGRSVPSFDRGGCRRQSVDS